jgi:hypothetical protein
MSVTEQELHGVAGSLQQPPKAMPMLGSVRSGPPPFLQ